MDKQVIVNLTEEEALKLYDFINKYSKDLEAEIDDSRVFIRVVCDTMLI